MDQNPNSNSTPIYRKKYVLITVGMVILLAAGIFAVTKLGSAKQNLASAPPKISLPAGTFAFKDGVYQVGKDIQPGMYRTKNTAESRTASSCYWIRSKGADPTVIKDVAGRSFHDIKGVGSQIVTILPTDVSFSSAGCGNWYTGLTRVTTSDTSFGPGSLIFGSDVKPGVYGSDGPISSTEPCYWVRLSDFTDTATRLVEKIDKGEQKGAFAVQIRASDKGFLSLGCRDFHKFAPVKLATKKLTPTGGTIEFTDGDYIVGTDINLELTAPKAVTLVV